MTNRSKSGGKSRVPTNVINIETKNDILTLKSEVLLKRSGGILLNANGSKVEFPIKCCSAKKEKFISATVPPVIRGYVCPWLGPNLRLASDIQMLWTTVKMRQPVNVFIPFSFATAIELTTPQATEKAIIAIKVAAEAAKASAKATAEMITETPPPEDKPKSKKNSKHNKSSLPDYATIEGNILDTRTVFLLQSKIGGNSWSLKPDITVVQPTVHYLEWPSSVIKSAYSAGRFSERKEATKPTELQKVKAAPVTASAALVKGSVKTRKSNGTGNSGKDNSRDNISTLDLAKRTGMFAGGVSFKVDEFCNFFAIVVATRSEAVSFDHDGGLLRSPLLHPLLSIRVPKLCTLTERMSTFKVLEVQPDLITTIHQFDPQLAEINECSDIYELDLGLEPFNRPVFVKLPLPKWYTDLIDAMIKLKEPVEKNASEKSLVVTEAKLSEVNANNVIPMEERPQNLILVFQPAGTKRQIVWRASEGDPNSDSMSNRRKAVKTGPFRDSVTSTIMRAESLNAKNGWMNLMLGIRGGGWKPITINGPFTPRCLCISTYQLGRFSFLYSNDPERTPSTKVAHLMGRMEALSVAPPGVLLVCLQVTNLKTTLWINVVPTSKLIEVLEERLESGFVPLVQTNASPTRKGIAVANCAIQSLPVLLPPNLDDSTGHSIPVYGGSKFRINGFDLLRILLYNGLCLKILLKGKLQFKTSSQFEALNPVLEGRRKTETVDLSRIDEFEVKKDDFPDLGPKSKIKPKVSVAVPIKKPEEYISTGETRLEYNDLMTDTATTIELEVAKEVATNVIYKRAVRDKHIQLLMSRRLAELDREVQVESTEQTTDTNQNAKSNDTSSDENIQDIEIVNGYDGDDGVTKQHFTDLLEAFTSKNCPTKSYEISKDIARRMCNIVDKSRAEESTELIQALYSTYLVGRVEIELIQPNELAQVREKYAQKRESDRNANNQQLAESPRLEKPEDGQNAVKWNDNNGDVNDDERKPLVMFDLLMDPEIFGLNDAKKKRSKP